MTHRDYTHITIAWTLIVFAFACLMEWAPFMLPFRSWCDQHDNLTGLIILAILTPFAIAIILEMRAYSRKD